ncbi:ABC transporter substrate-binding protein [soil metagenome]
MTRLRGITWDHPRGIDPLRVASKLFSQSDDTDVTWNARPLRAFEDLPVEALAERYDLIAIDHPGIGDARAAGALLPLDGLLTSSDLADRAADSAGPSHESYTWHGEQWALAVDAACMVTAYRSDLADAPPTSWAEFAAYAASIGRDKVAIAANPTHMFCTFLSLCEAFAVPNTPRLGAQPAWWTEDGFDPAVAAGAIDQLREVLARSSAGSLRSDPIAVLDRMAAGDVAYAPLLFGYVTYSLQRAGATPVTFVDAPLGPDGQVGTLTGGVGLAVSSQSEHPAEAARFALFATARESQRGLIAAAGGQPARRSAWQNASTNARAGDFFVATLSTMESSFLRPRMVGYPRFQARGGEALHALVVEGASTVRIIDELSDLWRSLVVVRW